MKENINKDVNMALVSTPGLTEESIKAGGKMVPSTDKVHENLI